MNERVSTHWEGCETAHHACAVEKLKQLTAYAERFKDPPDEVLFEMATALAEEVQAKAPARDMDTLRDRYQAAWRRVLAKLDALSIPSMSPPLAVTPGAAAAAVGDMRATGGTIAATLREHYLWAIECDHATKMDTPRCSCSRWPCDPQPSIGAAVERWIEHFIAQLPAAELNGVFPPLADMERDVIEAAQAVCGVGTADDFADLKDAVRAYEVVKSRHSQFNAACPTPKGCALNGCRDLCGNVEGNAEK